MGACVGSGPRSASSSAMEVETPEPTTEQLELAENLAEENLAQLAAIETIASLDPEVKKKALASTAATPWHKAYSKADRPDWAEAYWHVLHALLARDDSTENSDFLADVGTLKQKYFQWDIQEKPEEGIAALQREMSRIHTKWIVSGFINIDGNVIIAFKKYLTEATPSDCGSSVLNPCTWGEDKPAVDTWKDDGVLIDPRDRLGIWAKVEGTILKGIQWSIAKMPKVGPGSSGFPTFLARYATEMATDPERRADVVRRLSKQMENVPADLNIFKSVECPKVDTKMARVGYFDDVLQQLFDDSVDYNYERRANDQHRGVYSGRRFPHAHSHTYGKNGFSDQLPVISRSGEYYGLMVGGLFGAVTMVFIVVVFCVGLALGMFSCWGYMQQKALEKAKEEEMYLKADDAENDL